MTQRILPAESAFPTGNIGKILLQVVICPNNKVKIRYQGDSFMSKDLQCITGYFGKVETMQEVLCSDLPEQFTTRWDRWFDDMRNFPKPGRDHQNRCWRFMASAGIFCDHPVAGAWKMSKNLLGDAYPFVLARLGNPPAPDDTWYTSAGKLVNSAVDAQWSIAQISRYIQSLPVCHSTKPLAAGCSVFWLDDWEVQELRFNDIHDLADNGLRLMLALTTEPESA